MCVYPLVRKLSLIFLHTHTHTHTHTVDFRVYDQFGPSPNVGRRTLLILNDLQVLNLPKISVKIWGSKERFLEAQESSIGKRYPRSFGYVWWGEVRLRYRGSRTAQTAVHEFVHVVSQHINATIANNPRWLWESVAIYESGSPRFNPSKISYMKGGNYSSLSDLNYDFNKSREIYRVGHTLIEYIVQKWGGISVIQLIKTNGNIESVLKISTEEFEEGWYQYTEKKYLND